MRLHVTIWIWVSLFSLLLQPWLNPLEPTYNHPGSLIMSAVRMHAIQIQPGFKMGSSSGVDKPYLSETMKV